MKECPNCKYAGNNPEAKFCSNCGSPLGGNDYVNSEFVDYSRLMRNNRLETTVENGSVITPCSWDLACDFREGLARVEKDGKMGFIDMTGKMVIPNQWRIAGDFFEGLAMVKGGNGEYFIDRTGDIVINCPSNYSLEGDSFHEGLVAVERNGKYGYMDKRGNIVIPCKWESAASFADGLASVSNEDGMYGCIDKSGHLVIPCDYNEEIVFSEGLGMTYFGDMICYLDRTGRKVIELVCDSASQFMEGLASVCEQGFIDKNGDFVIEDKWCSCWDNGFSEGVAATDDWGYIDRSGRTVIRNDWETCHPFKEGLAKVEDGGKAGYIDHSGRQITSCVWDSGCYFHEGLASVRLSGKAYYINKQGKVLCHVQR